MATLTKSYSAPPKASDALVLMSPAMHDAGQMRANSARRSRRRRPSPEELEAHFRELEAFKKQEERRKKDAEKRFKQQCLQEKRTVQRTLQQAQREANARDSEVQRLMRQIEKVQSEQERQKARQTMHQERLDEALRKLREDRYIVESQYEVKLAEAGEARGRMELIDKVLRRDQSRANGEIDMEEGMELAQQELVKADIAQTRLRIQSLASDNGRLRQELSDLRRAVASRRQKVVEVAPLTSVSSPISASFEVMPSPATASTALPTYRPLSGSFSSVGQGHSAVIPSTVGTARSVPVMTQPLSSSPIMMRPVISGVGSAVSVSASPQSSHVPSKPTELIATGGHEKWNHLWDPALPPGSQSAAIGAHEKWNRLRGSSLQAVYSGDAVVAA